MNDIFVVIFLVSLCVTLGLGFPVALTLGGMSVLFALVADALGIFSISLMQALPHRIFGIMSNYTLLAIPYFIFMGGILEGSKIAENLLLAVSQILGQKSGGLPLAVVLVGTLLAATTGVVAATVVAMSLIALPLMLQQNTNPRLASGVIVASGTLGQIIPPSIVLVVLGDQLGVSVGNLFKGALIPGLILAASFAFYVVMHAAFFRWKLKSTQLHSLTNNSFDTSQPKLSYNTLLKQLVPPCFLIFTVLGSIFWGIATPTEAGALGCLGALILAFLSNSLNTSMLLKTAQNTVNTTAMVLLILLGSTVFSLVFRGIGGDDLLHSVMTLVPGGMLGFVIFSMLLVFTLGFFIDFFEICFIVVPLLLPIAKFYQIDLTWFGILLAMNLQTSFLTPPFGFSLFYLRGTVSSDRLSTSDLYKGVLPFVAIQISVLILLMLFPKIVSS